MDPSRFNGERSLRESLGIPLDAERVLIFADSSHWDPNWLYTSEEYYRRFVRNILDRAIEGLLREPRRIYTVESVFFLRMHWERRPEQRAQLATLVNNRRLRLASPAVTTADTLIPGPEVLLRDFLLGQEWLRSNGMTQEPKLAYFPDSFGSSPALPSLLQAAGIRQTAITRIDGMYFPGFALNNPRKYPRRGSSAELLLKHERTLDFLWRDRAGAEVLCHWNAFSYGQGDLLAHRGLSRVYLFPLAVPDRSEHNVARRIRRYAEQLLPLSRTPYLFCPIGLDFISPIPNLVSLLDRYNEKRYPNTGVWALTAGLDDYLDLVSFHRDRLPVIELDPNPYWTGFYTSRPALKGRCHALVDDLRLAEELSFFPENGEAAGSLNAELEQAWWTAAVANHHDFITGTAPDRTVEHEQVPWLEAARQTASETIDRLSRSVPEDDQMPAADPVPSWERRGRILEIRTPFYRLELDEEFGGAIARAEDPNTGEGLLGRLSNDLISYRDSGGLWRMGHEFSGGTWKPHRHASEGRVRLQVNERETGLEVSWVSELDGEPIQRSAWFRSDWPLIRFRVAGRAAKHRTLTVKFAIGVEADRLMMDMPGGVVSRPTEKLYSPTFWPFQHFVHIRDRSRDRGLAVFQRRPGSVAYESNREVEIVALRNATRERAYRVFPLPGNPAAGYEKVRCAFEYALLFTARGDWIDNALPTMAYAGLNDGWGAGQTAAVRKRSAKLLLVDRPDVWVLANKPASRGPGRIVRLYTLAASGQPVTLRMASAELKAAYLCDALERDLQPLQISQGQVRLTMPGTIASVRLISPGHFESED